MVNTLHAHTHSFSFLCILFVLLSYCFVLFIYLFLLFPCGICLARIGPVCVPSLHPCWWTGNQSHRSRHCNHLWLRLEPSEWHSGNGPAGHSTACTFLAIKWCCCQPGGVWFVHMECLSCACFYTEKFLLFSSIQPTKVGPYWVDQNLI